MVSCEKHLHCWMFTLQFAFEHSSAPRTNSSMRLGYLLLVAIGGLLACGDAVVVVSNSDMSKLTTRGEVVDREHIGNINVIRDDKRTLRTRNKAEEDESSDDPASAEADDEEERNLIISTLNRPKYGRWFHAGMTPYDVKEVLGLTGIRRLWKPIKRREYDGYVVFYSEHCRKPKYRPFCQTHTDA